MKTVFKSALFLFLAVLLGCAAHAQTFKWTKGGGSTAAAASIGSISVEATYKMCTDPHGNTYTLSVMGNAPMSADTFHYSTSGSSNLLFASYDCSGHMRFAKLISSALTDQQGIVADSLGNIYLAMLVSHGSSGSSVLRIGYDTTISTYVLGLQAIIKYDTSGTFKWIRFVGNDTYASYLGSSSNNNQLLLDNAQNPHLILYNSSGVVFRSGDTSLGGTTDLQYDPNGNLLTVKHLDLDSTLLITGASIDPVTNKLYAYGERSASYLSAGYSYYKFLAAFDTSRAKIWCDTLNNPGSISYGFFGACADGNGNLYASGIGSYGMTIFRNDTAFNTLSTTAYSSFVMKLDTSGAVKWLTNFSSSGISQLYNLVLSPNKRKLAFAGTLYSKIKCDIDSLINYPGEVDNPEFAILDTAGYVQELQQIHAPGANTWCNISAFDRLGNLIVGGRMESTVWGGTEPPYTSVGGPTDYFISKYGVDCNCTSMPVANFTSTLVGTHILNFTYTGTPGDSVRWYFGDGTTSTLLTPTHVYSASGTFTVRCRVYTACGRDLKGAKINLPCTYPGGAGFTHTGIYSIAFTYTGSLTDVDSIRWKFGDGGTSPLVNPSHTYATPGTYNACVKVYSWCGVDSFCTSIVVPCVASPAASLLVTGGGPARTFSYTGTTTAVSSYTWDYGDMSAPGSGTGTMHTYAAPGVYTVCVTATNPCGTNTYCTTINVTCMATPVAAMFKTGSLATRNFAYTGTTTGIDSIGWYFGDGGHVLSPAPIHMYGSIGTFTACAIAYSQCGTDTVCDTVFVPCLAPATATFTASGTTTDSTRNFTYTGTTTGVDSVRWNFGDGSGFTGTSATHTYHVSDTYTVCAVAYSACGNDTVCNTVVYHSTVGIQNTVGDVIRVYPNPTENVIFIETQSGSLHYKLLTVDGVVVTEGGLSVKPGSIDVRFLSTGLYLLELTDATNGRSIFKINKQ